MNKSIKTSLGLLAVCGSIFLMACGGNSTPKQRLQAVRWIALSLLLQKIQ